MILLAYNNLFIILNKIISDFKKKTTKSQKIFSGQASRYVVPELILEGASALGKDKEKSNDDEEEDD
jgi:hypothetical protein